MTDWTSDQEQRVPCDAHWQHSNTGPQTLAKTVPYFQGYCLWLSPASLGYCLWLCQRQRPTSKGSTVFDYAKEWTQDKHNSYRLRVWITGPSRGEIRVAKAWSCRETADRQGILQEQCSHHPGGPCPLDRKIGPEARRGPGTRGRGRGAGRG